VSAEQLIGLALAVLVMGIGLAGCIVPGLPSTPLVLLAAIGHKIYFGPEGVTWVVLVIMTAITLFSLVLDHLASIYGAKRLGATWKGVVGAVGGGLIGMLFGLPGILLGPFAGALLCELAGGRTISDSSRAGLGAVLGLLAGALGKLACCAAMMVLFAADVVF